MRWHRRPWLLCVLSVSLGVLAACGESDPTTEPPPPSDPVDDVVEAPEGHTTEREAPSPAELVRSTGTITMAGAALEPGSAIESDQTIDVPEEGRAVIQLRDGGRVELDGPARGVVLDQGGAQLLLIRGRLYAVQPPMGNAPRPPLRIVSAAATVEIGAAGEIYLASFESGASWLTVLGGAAAVENGEADVRRRLRSLDLSAGQAVAIPNRIAEPTEGPRTLSAAREAASMLMSGAPPNDAPDPRRDLDHEATRLDQALSWLETEARRGRELTTQHRAAVQDGDEEETGRLQRELVDHSRALYRMRRLAGARWERLQVRQLRVDGAVRTTADELLSTRQDRVNGLLGLTGAP
ncbi:MAG: hypothetical protein AB8I08_04605 [Sandaracinaceae bacterium]